MQDALRNARARDWMSKKWLHISYGTWPLVIIGAVIFVLLVGGFVGVDQHFKITIFGH